MSDRAKSIMTEIIDRFADGTYGGPGDEWAPDEDHASYGLDCRGKDGCKFWLDLDKNGTITIFWKRPDGTHEVLHFDAR